MIKKYLFAAGMALLSVVTGAQSVFDMPRLFPQHRRTLSQFMAALQNNNLPQAESAALTGTKLFPRDANWHYNVACVRARDNQPKSALEWLEKAVKLGFSDRRAIASDRDLVSLRKYPDFDRILKLADETAGNANKNPTLSRGLVTDVPMGMSAEVTAANTQWNWDPNQGGYMTTLFRPVPGKKVNPKDYRGPCADRIRAWMEDGTAAGNAGDFYVNRDEDTAVASYDSFPGLTPVLYGEEAVRANAHRGPANGLFSTGLSALPIIGNSAFGLPQVSPFWRSLPRMLATDRTQAQIAARLAVSNQLWIYDATQDVTDPILGDLQVTHLTHIVSTAAGKNVLPPKAQQQMTDLILAALAAMHPETKAEMYRHGQLVSTVQMLLRKSLKGAPDYFTPEAHPIAFNPEAIDAEALVTNAHNLRPATLPPVFAIRVRQESMPRKFIDFFDLDNSEGIVDTPMCITRILRGTQQVRRLTVEAVTPAESDTSFRWFTVSGDPKAITFRPLLPNGALTTIEAKWQGIFTHHGRPCRRVDLACVAVRPDGSVSAPAFVSLRALGNERRTFRPDGKPLSVDYTVPKSGYIYEDPVLTAFKNWTDTYRYDARGVLLGWTRTRPNAPSQDFDAQGRRIVEKTQDGRPAKLVNVTYLPRVLQRNRAVEMPAVELLQTDTGEPFAAERPSSL